MDPGRELLLKTRRFRVVRVEQPLADGGSLSREYVEHPGAVAVIPMVDERRLCLIENYRGAVGQTLLELPAGTLEPGEDPEETARRELTEETGYRADQITALCQFFVSPGIMNERMYLFAAHGLTPGDQDLEADEQIRTKIVDWDEAVSMAVDGRIQDAKSLVGLLLYDRIRRRA